MSRIFKVGISGSYGGWNLGDEAILRGILSELRRSLSVEVTVFSRDPEDTLRRHPVEHAVPMREMLREEVADVIAPLDLFVLGGGGILFDGEAEVFMREVEVAKELGVPVMIYAVGAGPLTRSISRVNVCRALDAADVVTVRDWRTKHLLEQCPGEKEITVTADPALLLDPEPVPEHLLEREGIIGGRPVVGMSVREQGPAAPGLDERSYHELLANAADYVIDRLDADVVLIPMERHQHDMQQCYSVLSRMSQVQRAGVLRGEYTAGQMLSIVGHFEFAVGMRLHFLIFAAMQHVPFVPLPYAPKVSGFVERFGIRTPKMERLNAGKLIAHIDRVWDHRDRLRAQIAQEMPRLTAKARENNRRLVELLAKAHRLEAPRDEPVSLP